MFLNFDLRGLAAKSNFVVNCDVHLTVRSWSSNINLFYIETNLHDLKVYPNTNLLDLKLYLQTSIYSI